ncbi:nucleotidyltransferase family protein [Uliginosibacterium gangwonense]|uniref:nucleotidyltransferase family protein n=1 Tax=Uliginosibacterium gangwonense TaxID=392736 RepID=UPI00037F4EF8|nr:nucleotidyltransferase family protein [Uliginosibacterium gangwonense]
MSGLYARTLALIASDPWRMECLRLAAGLHLPQWAIVAGFVRNAIWDEIFGVRTTLADIDLAYHCSQNLSAEQERAYERMLAARGACWQVRNQARMHQHNGVMPYASSADAVSRYPELATCLSICINPVLGLYMPNQEGLEDAWSGIVRPNPRVPGSSALLHKRLHAKGWVRRWPGLRILDV